MIELCLTDNSKKRPTGQEITKGGKGNVIFRYREICTATNKFNPRNQIGEGGFGRVYKGLIENSKKVQHQILSLFSMLFRFRYEFRVFLTYFHAIV